MAKGSFSKALSVQNMFMIVLVAVIGIYLWGTFTNADLPCTQAMIDNANENGCMTLADTYTEFVVPATTELESSTLWIIKLMVLGAAIYLGYAVVMKLSSGTMGRKHIMTLIMLGIAVYFIWEYVIMPSGILGASQFTCPPGATDCTGLTLDQIGKATAQKLGLG